MIVDSSAVLAIVLREPDRFRYVDAMLESMSCRMSVANWLEATMVVDRLGSPKRSAGSRTSCMMPRSN